MKVRGLLIVVTIGAMGVALVPSAAAGGGGSGRSPHTERIEIEDRCDPATFNADPPVGPGLGPGTCFGDRDTTFADFIAQMTAERQVDHWAFHPSEKTIRVGDSLAAVSNGGEFHTFTEVAKFGGGCVDLLNAILGLSPVPECAPTVTLPDGSVVPSKFLTTGVPAAEAAPGFVLPVKNLTKGTHLFQCLIHPWMKSTITVRAAS
jgi:plastocyanin